MQHPGGSEGAPPFSQDAIVAMVQAGAIEITYKGAMHGILYGHAGDVEWACIGDARSPTFLSSVGHVFLPLQDRLNAVINITNRWHEQTCSDLNEHRRWCDVDGCPYNFPALNPLAVNICGPVPWTSRQTILARIASTFTRHPGPLCACSRLKGSLFVRFMGRHCFLALLSNRV